MRTITIDPLFSTMEDLDRLIKGVTNMGRSTQLFNHTLDPAQWFADAWGEKGTGTYIFRKGKGFPHQLSPSSAAVPGNCDGSWGECTFICLTGRRRT